MITKAWVWRVALIGVAGILIPACKATPSAAVLLMDSFNGTFPGTAWATGGTGSAVKDTLIGFDPPSLRLSGTGGQTVTADTTATFNAAAMTFSVHMAADTAAGTDVGVGSIIIKDTFGEVASANWDAGPGGLLTLKILGVGNVQVAAPAADLIFHRLIFKVLANGTSTWTLDNGASLITAPFAAVSPVTVELSATYPAGTGFALFYFDNVNVTSP